MMFAVTVETVAGPLAVGLMVVGVMMLAVVPFVEDRRYGRAVGLVFLLAALVWGVLLATVLA